MEMRVEDIKPGMRVDLESCPFLNSHATAPYEYATVAEATRETENCVAISYEGIDTVGYALGTKLTVAD